MLTDPDIVPYPPSVCYGTSATSTCTANTEVARYKRFCKQANFIKTSALAGAVAYLSLF